MDTHPHVFLLHIDYYNFLRTIHLSIVVLRSAFGNSEELEPSRFQASEAICVEAARSFIKALNNMGDTSVKTHTLLFFLAHFLSYRNLFFCLVSNILRNFIVGNGIVVNLGIFDSSGNQDFYHQGSIGDKHNQF
ncbi:hypothetical protein CGCSCA4_v008114 [Colletotrichum siamense]|uniref:Uncharacterized protein n=1 Tax=Colletotrichum siamense TaxID=690259 RepID=A0A9P5K4N1_COLSI|nr:hypothetical protein CGCSCA4_v008114 [Colletotrichum siamense]KAF4859023.1 hypothetical protein CGCSCA2_v006618 [Colletotrichum siamense]